MPAALDRAAVAAVDPTGQAADILDLPTHLRDALWRVESAALKPIDAPGGLVVAGMGGSGVGGRLARSALWPGLRRPFVLCRDYALPAWTGPESVVLCSSYSGETEETLAAFADAGARGAARIVSTTGGELAARARRERVPVVPLPSGYQPRAAVGYSTVVALEVAALAGVVPSARAEVEAAAVLADELVGEWGPDGPQDGEAKALARRLHGAAPVVMGTELTGAAAYRWKCQLNENAKLPAFAAELPELDHNEIVGWAAASEVGSFAAVLLEDPGAGERNRARVELTAELVGAGAQAVAHVRPRGAGRLERLMSLVLLGDLVSLYLAVLRGVDPVQIGALQDLKAALARRA
ncbi:MAG TPA: bifunctional phosphoglucose/phosphomannose isomerase [Solirubrobacteraceae bacterium]|nr:bifunctional phosphoglucose/phosphomannose isomerase [Solirubrobacteraceae bacterium]